VSIIPKRGAIAAAITALGLALLFSFKTPSTSVPTIPRTGGAGGNGTDGGGTGGTGSGGTVSNSSGGGSANGTVTGPVEETQFGPVQLQITFASGKISDVQALQLPSDRQRSAQISSYVAPILRQEVLTAQNAQIQLISGATYTSYAYELSVQAILDQSHG
jgi:uncharacterized protein with FMN-binding domain